MIELTDNDMRIFLNEEEHWFPEEPKPEVDEDLEYREYVDMRLEDELFGVD